MTTKQLRLDVAFRQLKFLINFNCAFILFSAALNFYRFEMDKGDTNFETAGLDHPTDFIASQAEPRKTSIIQNNMLIHQIPKLN